MIKVVKLQKDGKTKEIQINETKSNETKDKISVKIDRKGKLLISKAIA